MNALFKRFKFMSVFRQPPWIGLLVSSAVALLLYGITARSIDSDASERFAYLARNAQNTISARIKSYTEVLRGSASMFNSADLVTREQFHAYVEGLALHHNFPAVQAFNFAEYVRGEDAVQFEARLREEQRKHTFGSRAFTIKPPGKRPEYAVITLIEGDTVAQAAFGFDILSVPYAAYPMLASRDTGTMITSGLSVAAISTPSKTFLSMRLPIYRARMPINTVPERRAAYLGSLGIAFSVPLLVKGVLDEMPIDNVRMILTDNGLNAGEKGKTAAQRRLLFDSRATEIQPSPAFLPDTRSFTIALPVDYNGRAWEAMFRTPKGDVYTQIEEYAPWLAMATGFVSSMLIYALFHTLTTSRGRALEMAKSMTRELRESQDKLQLSHQKLRRLVAHADQIKEGERKRIAREIHDDLGQNLLALRIDADMLSSRTRHHHPRLHARVNSTLFQIDATIKSVRQIINDLRPNVLDLGLSAAVEWQIAEFSRRTGITCELIDEHHEIKLSDSSATAFFRILQESLTNIIRHANATAVKVELQIHDGTLTMSISDNGIGLRAGGRNKPGSFGLVGIEERVTILGGSFTLTSVPGNGTTICVSVPVNEDDGDSPVSSVFVHPATVALA